jgi:hypothetical protein
LVYHQAASDNLPLGFTFESPNHDHMWSVRIDALNGCLKKCLVISCQFDRDIPYAHEETGSESWFTSFIIP